MSSFSFMMKQNHLFNKRKFFSLIYSGKIILTCIYIYIYIVVISHLTKSLDSIDSSLSKSKRQED